MALFIICLQCKVFLKRVRFTMSYMRWVFSESMQAHTSDFLNLNYLSSKVIGKLPQTAFAEAGLAVTVCLCALQEHKLVYLLNEFSNTLQIWGMQQQSEMTGCSGLKSFEILAYVYFEGWWRHIVETAVCERSKILCCLLSCPEMMAVWSTREYAWKRLKRTGC